jgi:ABC-2 type transport system permease protein
VRLLAAQVRASVLELLRYPAYSLPTLLFPATLYLVVVAGRAKGDPAVRMAGFAAIAVLGVAFFQFGVGIANDRGRHWERYLRTLPAPPSARIAGRVLSALVFAGASAGAVVLAARGAGVAVSAARLSALAGALALGAVPFALLGISLGYTVPARAAVPVANLLYLPLAYVGGLWSGPRTSPRVPAVVPTRSWAELVWAAAGARAFSAWVLVALAAWTAVFAAAAVWAYRRDEGERFR